MSQVQERSRLGSCTGRVASSLPSPESGWRERVSCVHETGANGSLPPEGRETPASQASFPPCCSRYVSPPLGIHLAAELNANVRRWSRGPSLSQKPVDTATPPTLPHTYRRAGLGLAGIHWSGCASY